VGALERVKGPEHADAALALNSLGALYATEGHDARGLELFERVLAIRQRTLPPDHPWIASAHYNIAVVLNNMRRWSDAIPHYEASIRIGALDPEADASGIAAHRIGLGSTLVAAGETARAIEVLRETLPVVEREALRDPWFERQLADGRFALARAIAKDEPQSAEAVELATAARDYYQVHAEHPRHHLERIQTWLTGHAF
jgi:tetratricopeptide (TPR) repeat protein